MNLGQDSGPYERPSQPWVCGGMADGRPCPLGPDGRGLCRQTPPCRPTRSWRQRRSQVAWWTLALTVALVLVAVLGAADARWFTPGPLHAGHAAAVGEGAGFQTCQACHQMPAGGGLGLLTQAWHSSATKDTTDQCLTCHQYGAAARQPHSLNPADLGERPGPRGVSTGEPPSDLQLARQLAGPPGERGELACAVCHQEHRGAKHDLKALSNTQCQSCHQQPFASLANGHPEFTQYPHTRRTRIQFDHAQHVAVHFRDRQVSCTDCHQVDGTGRDMLTRDFATACGDCHSPATLRRSPPLAWLTLPPVALADTPALAAQVGPWPATDPDLNGRLTAITALLLLGDPSLTPVNRATLGAQLDRFRQLDLAAPEDLSPADSAVVAAILPAIRHLVGELASGGHERLRARLHLVALSALSEQAAAWQGPGQATTGTVPKEWLPELDALLDQVVAGLPAASLRELEQRWFAAQPALAPHPSGTKSPPAAPVLPNTPVSPVTPVPPAPPAPATPGGFQRPPGKLFGDDPEPAPAPTPPPAKPAGGGLLDDDEEDDAAPPLLKPAPAPTPSPAPAKPAAGGLLGDDEDEALPLLKPAPAKPAGGGLLGDDVDEDDEPAVTPPSKPATPAAPRRLPARELASQGGWYLTLDGQLEPHGEYSLHYRATGHADPVLRAWLELAAGLSSDPATAPPGPVTAAATRLFGELRRTDAAGQCGKCHSAEPRAKHPGPPRAQMQWQAAQPTPSQRPFTRYHHQVHFYLPKVENCNACHQLAPAQPAAFQARYQALSPVGTGGSSGFANISKATCVACHTPQAAGDSCLQCHNYHIGERPPTVLQSQIRRLPEPPPTGQ